MASPSESTSRARTPTVPSVRMASPKPLCSRNDLTSMEVDHILALVGGDYSDYLPSERRDQAWQLYAQGQVIHDQDGWMLNWDYSRRS